MRAAALTILTGDFGHMDMGDWGAGWWIVMVLVMIAFWALVIAGVVWLVRVLVDQRHAQPPNPLAVLDRRLAEGAISPEEYRERRAVLTRD